MKLSFIEILIILAVILLGFRIYRGIECHDKGGILYQWQCVRADILN